MKDKLLTTFFKIRGHNYELLCCDYCKYKPHLVGIGSSNGDLRIWDLRRLKKPLINLNGHQYAVIDNFH